MSNDQYSTIPRIKLFGKPLQGGVSPSDNQRLEYDAAAEEWRLAAAGATLPIVLTSDVSGILPRANGGTQVDFSDLSGKALQSIRVNAGESAFELATVSASTEQSVALDSNEQFPASTTLERSPRLSGLTMDADSTYILDAMFETDNNANSRDIKFRFSDGGSGTFQVLTRAWRRQDNVTPILVDPLADSGVIDILAQPVFWSWYGRLRTIVASTNFGIERANGNDTGSQTMFEGSYIHLTKLTGV